MQFAKRLVFTIGIKAKSFAKVGESKKATMEIIVLSAHSLRKSTEKAFIVLTANLKLLMVANTTMLQAQK
jgi:N6-adenosine-specific RNA methylase IME4